MRRRRHRALRALVGSLALHGALSLALAPTAYAQTAPAHCGDWELRGASQDAGADDVSFVEAWRPLLAEVVSCLQQDTTARACVEVQGQYDDQTFPPAVERALGGARAAQLDRARGRGEAVLTELDALGVTSNHLRMRPPPTSASFRGVIVRVVPACLPEPVAASLPEWMATPERMAAALRDAGLGQSPAPASEASAGAAPAQAAVTTESPPAPAFTRFSLDGRVSVAYSLAGDFDAFSVGFHAAFAWNLAHAYLRANIGVGTADQLEQRAFVDWGVAVGARPLPWLNVGATFMSRVSAYRLRTPWLEQAWLLGVESEQRLAALGAVSVWVGESLYPVGLRVQRGRVVSGQLANTPDRRDYAVRVELQLIVRGHLPR